MRGFVIRGFGVKRDQTGREFDFDRVDRELIAPALAECRLEGGTTVTERDAGSIHADMFELILSADVVVCDVTVHNANVFYELGVRHALRRKHTVLIKAGASADTTPFDIGGFRYLGYDADQPGQTLPALVQAIQAGLAGERPTDSPVFHYLEGLAEARPETVSPATRAFLDAVDAAAAAQDADALRRLAGEASNLRYPWSGVRAVARAQTRLRLLDDAHASWTRLRAVAAHALEANLALGNLCERLSRQVSGPARRERLAESNRALSAVLDHPDADLATWVEARALQARNLKTVWRLDWEPGDSVAARRGLARTRDALECHAGYRAAFGRDLNGYYPGIAALQMHAILLMLAAEPGWADLFDSDEDASKAHDQLRRDWPAQCTLVLASIDRALNHGSADDRKWAAISKADWLLLTEAPGGGRSARLERAYTGAVPKDDAFAHDAAVGQLALFVQLDLHRERAQGAIDALAAR